jgi:hypothetical protein
MSASHDEQLIKLGRKKIKSPDGKNMFFDIYQFPQASFEQGLNTWNYGRNTKDHIKTEREYYKHIKLMHRKGHWWLTYEETPTRTGTGPFDQPEGAIGWFERSGR